LCNKLVVGDVPSIVLAVGPGTHVCRLWVVLVCAMVFGEGVVSTRYAATVHHMFVALLGLVIAALIVVGPLNWLESGVGGVTDGILQSGQTLFAHLLQLVPEVNNHTSIVSLVSVTLAVMLPGLVCLLLGVGATKAGRAQHLISSVLMVGAIAAMFVLPFNQAILLVLVGGAISGLLLSPVTFITRTALWALAGIIAFDHVAGLWYQQSPVLGEAVAAVTSITSLDSPELWRIAFMIVGLAPFVAVLGVATDNNT